MEAQRKDFDNKIQFVTIQLELTEEYHAALEVPAPSAFESEDGPGSGGGKPGSRADADDATPMGLPKDLRLWH